MVTGQQRTPEEVASLREEIQRRLDSMAAKVGFRLQVVQVVQEAQWTTFIVRAEGPDVRAYDYVDALATVEEQLQEERGEQRVQILPALPG